LVTFASADRTSDWVFVGVSNRLVGFLDPLFSDSTECKCCISSITSSAVRFIPAEESLSSNLRKQVAAATQVNK